jgi:hypothetical protein
VDAAEIAKRIGLGADYTAWLESLEALGPPPGGLAESLDAGSVLEQVRMDPLDRPDILSAVETLTTLAEWRWLLEHAYHAVRTDVGDTEGMRRMPALPANLGSHARCFWIVVFLVAVPDIRGWHQAHGIAEHVSWDTLEDLARHTRLYRQRTGHTGLDTQWWISLHFRGGLFAIGRLQYVPFRLQTGPAGPLYWYAEAEAAARGPGFSRGDVAIGLHIPQSGPLTPELCGRSFADARTFFNRRSDTMFSNLRSNTALSTARSNTGFSNERSNTPYADAVVTCTSWLLDDQLCDYLAADSNIVLFQRRFELVPGALDSDASAFHFVFGRPPEDIDALTPRTTLEEAIVRHVRQGGHWRMRTGWLRLADQS